MLCNNAGDVSGFAGAPVANATAAEGGDSAASLLVLRVKDHTVGTTVKEQYSVESRFFHCIVAETC